MPYLLCKRYYVLGKNKPENIIDRIEAEFKTDGLVISQYGMHRQHIKINKRGQEILCQELKKRFEKRQERLRYKRG